jgi:hypothetical protein
MRLYYSPDDPEGGGEPVAVVTNDSTAPWDNATALPDDPALSSLKGKTAADLVLSYGELRGKMDQQGKENAALTKQLVDLKKAGDVTDPALDQAGKDIVESQDFGEVLDNYIGTGEVSELFLDVITTQGMKPTREDVLDFLEFKKFQRNNLIEHAAVAASEGGEEVKPEQMQDVIAWMNSGQSTFSKGEIDAFNSLGQKGNWTWVSTVMEEFTKAGGPTATGNRFIDAGQNIRGRAVTVAGDKEDGFATAADFQAALSENWDHPNRTASEKRRRQKELIAKRDRTR